MVAGRLAHIVGVARYGDGDFGVACHDVFEVFPRVFVQFAKDGGVLASFEIGYVFVSCHEGGLFAYALLGLGAGAGFGFGTLAGVSLRTGASFGIGLGSG